MNSMGMGKKRDGFKVLACIVLITTDSTALSARAGISR